MTFYPYAFHTTPYKIQKEFSFATRKTLLPFIHNYKISYYESYPFGFIVCQRHVSAHISFIFFVACQFSSFLLLFQGQHSIPEYHPVFVQRLRKESSYLLLFQKHATFQYRVSWPVPRVINLQTTWCLKFFQCSNDLCCRLHE